jgi:hypothetical protein
MPESPRNHRTQLAEIHSLVLRKAVSCVEAVVAIAILGSSLAMAVNVFAAFARNSAANRETALATELAAQLAAEIHNCIYEEYVESPIGRESGEDDGTRLYFEDVDDYDAYYASPPQLRDGTVLTDLAGFAQNVSVVFDGSTAHKKITVTITRNGLKRAEIVLGRSRHNADQR